MRSASTGVVLLNYGDPTDTLACLASLELSDDLDLDVVVVDNGEAGADHDGLVRSVGARATTIATGTNLGYAAGNNIGIDFVLSRGCDLVWILNPDTVVDRHTLPSLKEALAAIPDCGIVGPRIYFADQPRRIWFDGGVIDRETASTRHLHMGAGPSGLDRSTVDVDYVTGASMLVRRSLLEQVGLIPPEYFLYHEEADWCLRAQRAGWRTMTHRAATMWHHKRSSGLLPQPYYLYYMTRNRYLFAERALGVSGERALVELDRTFLEPWRAKVEDRAPHWLDEFDSLVGMAKADAREGIDGRRAAVDAVPAPAARS